MTHTALHTEGLLLNTDGGYSLRQVSRRSFMRLEAAARFAKGGKVRSHENAMLVVLGLLWLALSSGCAATYVPSEWTLRDGVIPPIDEAGTVTFTNAQPSKATVSVYSYLGAGFEGNLHEITELMVKQAAGELKKNGRPRRGKAKTIAVKVTFLQSRYIAFFWRSTIKFTADLGDGKTVSKEVDHASGDVMQDLNGCIAEGVIYLLNDETVRAYLASA
jgi:hypothetical protein